MGHVVYIRVYCFPNLYCARLALCVAVDLPLVALPPADFIISDSCIVAALNFGHSALQ